MLSQRVLVMCKSVPRAIQTVKASIGCGTLTNRTVKREQTAPADTCVHALAIGLTVMYRQHTEASLQSAGEALKQSLASHAISVLGEIEL